MGTSPKEEVAVRLVALTAVLVVVLALAAFAGKPVATAHGEFRGYMHLQVGPWNIIMNLQLTFNVQDRGENDHGSMSVRYFWPDTGELAAIAVSTGISNVYLDADGAMMFTATFRPIIWEEGLPFLATGVFRAVDGAPDSLSITYPFSLPLIIEHGKVVIR
ncbi:hypothetical protein ACFLSF_00105 [Candidatus Bipolaricaulota bacterium]